MEVLVGSAIALIVMYGVTSLINMSVNVSRHVQTKSDFITLTEQIDVMLNDPQCSSFLYNGNSPVGPAKFRPSTPLPLVAVQPALPLGIDQLASIGTGTATVAIANKVFPTLKISSLALTQKPATIGINMDPTHTKYLVDLTLSAQKTGKVLLSPTISHVFSVWVLVSNADYTITTCGITRQIASLPGTGTAGQIVAFGMNPPPLGWLPCDGSPVSRQTYSSLFSAIGTTYGAGDGSTTFNLPYMEPPKSLVGSPHRYWRHHVKAINFPSGGVLAIMEINFKIGSAWQGNTGTNGLGFTTSNQIGPYPVTITNSTATPGAYDGKQAFDGMANAGVFFQSLNFSPSFPYSGDAWIAVDFGTAKVVISGLSIQPLDYTVAPKTWYLEYSDDGANWFTMPGSQMTNVAYRFSYIYEFAGSGGSTYAIAY
ncbi:MAG: tail fiber protein [Deltaproteobacteria bacterium]|nr:tail fiber protein [Deltaproteobacteria bacterium]